MRARLATIVVIAISLPSWTAPLYGQTTPSQAPTTANKSLSAKKCDAMQRRIAKEHKSLASFDETIASEKKGRETCSTRPMCARYDQAIKTMESRKTQHEARLSKFKSDAEKLCKPA